LHKTLNLKLRVLPFKLSEPRTCYDLNKEFISSIYYRGILHPEGKCLPNSDWKTSEQLRAEFQDMLSHNIVNPGFCGWGTTLSFEDIKTLREVLRTMRDSGFKNKSLLNWDPFFPALADPSPKNLNKLDEQVRILLQVAREFGIYEVYFGGLGEVVEQGQDITFQRPAWEAIRKAGGKVAYCGGITTTETVLKVADVIDLFAAGGPPSLEKIRRWHSLPHKSVILHYGDPFGGVENPELNRRNLGLRLWKAEYGVSTYCYQIGVGSWNDWSNAGEQRPYSFAYPTIDGVVDTIAWEGFREGIDDIKYATTLKLEIKRVKEQGSPRKKKIAEEAEKYLANLDVNGNLDIIRSKIITYLLKLKEIEK